MTINRTLLSVSTSLESVKKVEVGDLHVKLGKSIENNVRSGPANVYSNRIEWNEINKCTNAC